MYPNDLNIQFYWNDRLGPCAIIPNLKSKYCSINTLRFNSFACVGPKLFNMIPKSIKTLFFTVNGFKKSLDAFLMNIPDCPPTPGYRSMNNNSLLEWAENRRTYSFMFSEKGGPVTVTA